MKNVLIYYKKEDLAPTGGPRGYLYNLNKGLEKIQNSDVNVSFLESTSRKGLKGDKTIKDKYEKLPLSIKNLYRKYGRYTEYRALKACVPCLKLEDISSYDAIHFHDVFSVYRNRKILECYKGKVIITTHCPKPPHFEKVEDMYSEIERRLYGKKHLAFYESCVKYAFKRANHIIFPCKEAEEPYYKHWDYYSVIHENYDYKFEYLPTGLQDCLPKVKFTREEVRKKYNIPLDAFVISFVGRHNAVKGYDILRNIALSLKDENIYFLIAGEEAPLTRPNVNNWREIGWTKDPYSIIKSSDLFILPNKETYFDLVLLEVLSLGTAVLISRTGGNKFFSTLNSGIQLYDNEKQAIEIISACSQSMDKINEMGIKNRQLFESMFTDISFAQNYLELLGKL